MSGHPGAISAAFFIFCTFLSLCAGRCCVDIVVPPRYTRANKRRAANRCRDGRFVVGRPGAGRARNPRR